MIFFSILYVMVMKMFKKSMIVFAKEIKCIIRDKKTFVLGLLMPLLLVPALLFLVNLSFSSFFSDGTQTSEVKVAFNESDNAFYRFCNSQSQMKIVEISNAEKSLNSGEIDAYISVDPSFDDLILKNKFYDINSILKESYSDASISNSVAKVSMTKYKTEFQKILEDENCSSIDDLYQKVNIDMDAALANDDYDFDLKSDINTLCFILLVPTMIILYCGTSSMSTAGELGVGEKERGTLESLLSTGANRFSIIFGKLCAITFMGTLGGICAVLGLWSYMMTVIGPKSSPIDVGGAVALLAMTIAVSMLFSSINLMISVYAKSYKEAQTYSLPFVMICLAPTFFTYTLVPADITITDMCIPMYNVACVLKEIFAKSINITHVLITISWMIVYSLAAFAVTNRLFKKENIIFRV